MPSPGKPIEAVAAWRPCTPRRVLADACLAGGDEPLCRQKRVPNASGGAAVIRRRIRHDIRLVDASQAMLSDGIVSISTGRPVLMRSTRPIAATSTIVKRRGR